MSSTLGPIHYMMYEKIKFQDIITDYLMDHDTREIDKIQKPVSTDDLSSLIDQENIHGWLSSRIDMVEKRLALAFKLSKNPKQKMYELGRKKGENKDFSSLSIIFKTLNYYLLDGMPCDNGMMPQVDDENSLYLITNNNLHTQYYENDDINPNDSLDDTCAGGHSHDHHENFELHHGQINLDDNETDLYHQMRYEFLKGYFENSPYKVEIVNGISYKISDK
ncbi:MAG: hypothetical protein Q4B52_04660 [Tissierellia bacterium]|nr:hypothetical protein [Tissierellia bacterium]